MKCAFAAGVLLAVEFFSAAALAVPINGDAALPISEGVWLTRQQMRYHRLNDDRQEAGRKMLALEIPMLLAYGVTANDGVISRSRTSARRCGAPTDRGDRAKGWAMAPCG